MQYAHGYMPAANPAIPRYQQPFFHPPPRLPSPLIHTTPIGTPVLLPTHRFAGSDDSDSDSSSINSNSSSSSEESGRHPPMVAPEQMAYHHPYMPHYSAMPAYPPMYPVPPYGIASPYGAQPLYTLPSFNDRLQRKGSRSKLKDAPMYRYPKEKKEKKEKKKLEKPSELEKQIAKWMKKYAGKYNILDTRVSTHDPYIIQLHPLVDPQRIHSFVNFDLAPAMYGDPIVLVDGSPLLDKHGFEPATSPPMTRMVIYGLSTKEIVIENPAGVTVGAVYCHIIEEMAKDVDSRDWTQMSPDEQANLSMYVNMNRQTRRIPPGSNAGTARHVDALGNNTLFTGLEVARNAKGRQKNGCFIAIMSPQIAFYI